MQDIKEEQKRKTRQDACDALGRAVKKLRGKKSQYVLGAEYDIPTSILSELERGIKDPQFTTVARIAEGLGLKASDLVIVYEKELPEGFRFSDI